MPKRTTNAFHPATASAPYPWPATAATRLVVVIPDSATLHLAHRRSALRQPHPTPPGLPAASSGFVDAGGAALAVPRAVHSRREENWSFSSCRTGLADSSLSS